MTPKISLSESGSFLLIYPIAVYHNCEFCTVGLTWQHDKNLNHSARDWQGEELLTKAIADMHPTLNPKTNQDFLQMKFKDALRGGWLMEMISFCHDNDIEVDMTHVDKITLNPSKPKINYQISSGISWVDFKVDVHFNQQRVSIKELRRAIINNERHVKLEDGSIGYLNDEWIAILQPIFLFGQHKGENTRLKKNQYTILKSIEKKDILEKEVREHVKKEDFKLYDNLPVPSKISATVRDYQMSGFQWLVSLAKSGRGACLADDMGLGKTLQVLMYICSYLEENKKTKPILVICPTSLLFNWKNEALKFAPSLRLHTHWGGQRKKELIHFTDHDIVLTTYGTMVSDIEFLKGLDFGIAVLDESQAIKTPTSQRTRCAKQLKAESRIVMTGTPIENNTFELWSQMDFINPGLLGNFHQFKNYYNEILGKINSKRKAQQLKNVVKPYILRRLKTQVAKELPPKTETTLYCEMETEQRNVYEKYRKGIQSKMIKTTENDVQNFSRFNLLAYLLRLRQLCNSTHLLNDKKQFGNHSIKIKTLMQHILQKHNNHKILVFTQFLGMIDEIGRALKKENIGYCELTGATKDRESLVNTFEKDDEKRVFLISIKAGGTGLNLVSADYVYIIDPWWNPAIENQAIDRAYRIGQTKKVIAYRMICTNSIEEKIQLLQQRKQKLSDDLIQAEDGITKHLSKEDFMRLLE